MLQQAHAETARAHAEGNANDSLTQMLRRLLIAVFALTATSYVLVSWNWKLMANPPLMHYIVFLLHRGLRPYSQITDGNMPGAYITQAAAMAVFGTSDFAWRLYEFFLLGVMSTCMVAIARRWDWLAGLVAATLFIAVHGSEGAEYAGERDLVAAVLALVAVTVFIEALSRRSPAWMIVAGVGWGLAASIKPTFASFPVGLALLAMAVCVKRGERWRNYLLWISAGLLCVGLLILAFLLHFGALRDFFHVLTSALPSYAGMTGGSTSWIGYRALPHRLLPLVGVAVALALVQRNSWDLRHWPKWTLLAGSVFGLLSFLVQGKGFVYHRYAFLMFVLLFASCELVPAFRAPGWPRWVAAAATFATLAAVLPASWINARALSGESDLAAAFQSDLETLGGAAVLQDKVQCLDLSYGCLNALYHLRIVENSGFTGDLMLFRPQPSPSRETSRAVFWQRAHEDAATVLMVSNQNFGVDDGFRKLDHWPQFESYLEDNYVFVVERRFPHEHFGGKFRETVAPADQDGYRLYIRRDSSLLTRASSLLLQARPSGLAQRELAAPSVVSANREGR